jgi:hypothetical protein
MVHPAVAGFVDAVAPLDWISDVWLSGSLASGDHRPGSSDIDIVALTTRPAGNADLQTIRAIHTRLDRGEARGAALGCAYVPRYALPDIATRHPTWTHGRMVQRHLSPIARAELVRVGRALVGREPDVVLPAMTLVEVRAAAGAELSGYWSWAARRPWLFLEPATADLALVSMARIRHAVRTGALISKSEAIPAVRAPRPVVEDLRRRRDDATRRTIPDLRLSLHAWRDTCRTISEA